MTDTSNLDVLVDALGLPGGEDVARRILEPKVAMPRRRRRFLPRGLVIFRVAP